MQIVKRAMMNQMDQQATARYGIPSILLMEHAAMAVLSYMIENVAKQAHILLLCGPGNNGGDGFALARLLVQEQYEHIHIYCCVPVNVMSEDERSYANIAKQYGIAIHTTRNMEDVQILLQQQDVFVDALFGTGLTRPIDGFYEWLITQVNAFKKEVISIDVASGIHADTGEVMNCAIQASTTISFVCMKQGHVLYPGSHYCGNVIVKDITMPLALQDIGTEGITMLDDPLIASFLPKREKHSNKSSFGKVLMVGGSSAMHGAITLAARGALASGVGTLTLCIPDSIHAMLAGKLEECMLLSGKSKDGYFDESAVFLLQQQLVAYDLITIGNGIGRNKACEEMVKVILESDIPCIIDGDALYELGKHTDLLNRKAPTILTPHPKEMSYLIGTSVKEVLQDPKGIAEAFVKTYPNVILVLKDQHTLICNHTTMYMNLAGNHALAKGGSGDVLCGILTGLFAQGKNALHSACCAVYVHAISADHLLEEKDGYSILPSDLVKELSNSYQMLKKA